MTSGLATYRKKRNFARTAEPRGGRAEAAEKRRFVIQHHAARRLHFDLRLEIDGVFHSWAVTRAIASKPGEKRLAVEVENHPLEYGDFEGTIPKGEYGGGTVMIWDRGHWAPVGTTDVKRALARGELKFILAGEKLRGSWVLVRMEERDGGKRRNWLLIKHSDRGLKDAKVAVDDDKSVASGRTMEEIASGKGPPPKAFVMSETTAGKARSARSRGLDMAPGPKRVQTAMPPFCEPQLCRLVSVPPSTAGWVHEAKLDGYRMQIRVKAGHAEVRTRTGLEWTGKMLRIARAAARLPDCMLDGEVVSIDDEGLSSFHRLQDDLSSGTGSALRYYAFDLLFIDGEDVRGRPLLVRKQRLKALLDAAEASVRKRIIYLDHITGGSGRDVLASACKMRLEGIVSKNADAAYKSGRGPGWTKAKCRPGQEVVVGGFSERGGTLRSLLVGVPDDGKLRYAGRVGTGFTAAIGGAIRDELSKIETAVCPFQRNAPKRDVDVRWVKPSLVAEIEFAGFTVDGLVRQASFKGMRADKPPSDVKPEYTAGEESSVRPKTASLRRAELPVRVSNPKKLLWEPAGGLPGVSKEQLARYLLTVGPRMLEYIAGRPCSIVRAPDGIGGEMFFQRHAGRGMSDQVTLTRVEGDRKPYIQIDTIEQLIAMAQLATVEFHPWNCAPGEPSVPGRLVFDLDPGPGVPFDRVVRAAVDLREVIADAGLAGFCKTTGGKGLHVVVPLARDRKPVAWADAKRFSEIICRRLAATDPNAYVLNMSKARRQGRIFLDYLRNDRMATAVASYSPRARPGAPVSMPLAWSEVKAGLDPTAFSVQTVPDLLAKSRAWTSFDKSARSLRSAIEKSGE